MMEMALLLNESSEIDLYGKTAVVTGGRVNLGFHTALRLLRCGAKVIVTSRYPYDTERRYREVRNSPNVPSQDHFRINADLDKSALKSAVSCR